MEAQEAITKLLKELTLPSSKVIVVPTFDEIRIGVFWPLDTDKHRPSKLSKTIAITLKHEDSYDFSIQSDAQKGEGIERLKGFLVTQLRSFEPEHNESQDKPRPVEEWEIGSLLVGN